MGHVFFLDSFLGVNCFLSIFRVVWAVLELDFIIFKINFTFLNQLMMNNLILLRALALLSSKLVSLNPGNLCILILAEYIGFRVVTEA